MTRDADGQVRLRQSVSLTSIGTASDLLHGGLWGTLVGLLFLNPRTEFAIGGAVGAGVGAVSGALSDFVIDDDFIKSLGETITPNSSALFILVRKATPERVMDERSDVKGKVLRTSLSNEQEKRLRKALQDLEREAAA